MSDDQVLFARHNRVCIFKLSGDVRHTQSAGLDQFVRSLFEEQKVCDEVMVDLSACRYLDSTSLGLLAMIARLFIKQNGRPPSMLVTEKDILALISSMCLDKVFHLVQHGPSDVQMAFSEVPSQRQDEQEHIATILRAHEELLSLDQANREVFQPVVDLMRQELAEKNRS